MPGENVADPFEGMALSMSSAATGACVFCKIHRYGVKVIVFMLL